MKSFANILRRSNITPKERVQTLVHNDVHKEKTGKDILSENDIYSLTKAWRPAEGEAREYNRYIGIVQLENCMKMDTLMFFSKSTIALLRNQRIVDSFSPETHPIAKTVDKYIVQDVPKAEAIEYCTQVTYLEYQKLLHVFTFNNLPETTQRNLKLLDEFVASEKQYLEDQVFLYELFKNGEKLSEENKTAIINRIYSRVYYEKMKEVKGGAEKAGFLIHSHLAEFPVKEVVRKLLNDKGIPCRKSDSDEEILSAFETYANRMEVSMEFLFKETLSHWLDQGLFVKDYPPLFANEHRDLFMAWYAELQKSKQYFQELFDAKKLKKQKLETEFWGRPKTLEIVTGKSIYAYKEDIFFVKEYRRQVEILVPFATLFLFTKKHASPVKNYKSLCVLKDLAQKISDIFDVDMTEKYAELIDSFKDEVKLLNLSLGRLIDVEIQLLCLEDSFHYALDIIDNAFSFDLDADDGMAEIAHMYMKEFEKAIKPLIL